MALATDQESIDYTSVCPLDCADTCSLSITLENDRVTRVRGSRDNPFTRGKLCAKVSNALADQAHGAGRIHTPLLRSGSKRNSSFEPISWDAALDLIAQRFGEVTEQWGAQAIAPLSYGGPMGLLAGNSMNSRFFNRLGASHVDSSPLCAGTSSAAWNAVFGEAGGIDFEELEHSRLILVWGNNVTTCNLHLTNIIRDAKKAGSTLVVIDPKRTRIARDADLHIPILPGTDVVLAYAVAALLEEMGGLDQSFIQQHVYGAQPFLSRAREYSPEHAAEICGIDAELIRQLAHHLTMLAPAAMSMGVAPERNRNGGAGIRSALALLALTGNIGPLGAGPCDVSRFFPVQWDALQRPDLAPASVRELNVLDIPRYVLEPGDELPLKAIFIYNHNPVAVHPQQARMREALLSEDVFVVGCDITMTDSMACADLVLPSPSHLEYGDVYTAYGHRYLQRSQPVLPPQGESRSNMDLFRQLAQRFGFDEPCFSDSDEALMAQAFVPTDGAEHPAQLASAGALDMSAYAEPAMLRGATLSTPSGRIELYSDSLEEASGDGLPRFKALPEAREFIVVSPASEQRINSTFGGLAAQHQDVCCEINPHDARRHSITVGDGITLHNAGGEITLAAQLNDDVRPGTLFVPKGAWMNDPLGGKTINALIPGYRENLVGGACYYDCSVDIRKSERPA